MSAERILFERMIENLESARAELLSIPKSSLTFLEISSWNSKWAGPLTRAQVHSSVSPTFMTYQHETDTEVLHAVRTEIVGIIDNYLSQVGSSFSVRPLLDELILQIQDPKLSMLLREFNLAKDNCPNLAAMGFRTILSLIILERARRVDPSSALALRTDMKFERDVHDAVAANPKIFDDAELRLLQRYDTGLKQSLFNNVVHKLGPNHLISKIDLEEAVILLNYLLPTII